MTDLEWWFTQFTFLRNAIAHGDEIADADLDHDGKRHIRVAEARLRQAIKHTVAGQAAEPDILVDPLERAARRAIRALEGGLGIAPAAKAAGARHPRRQAPRGVR